MSVGPVTSHHTKHRTTHTTHIVYALVWHLRFDPGWIGWKQLQQCKSRLQLMLIMVCQVFRPFQKVQIQEVQSFIQWCQEAQIIPSIPIFGFRRINMIRTTLPVCKDQFQFRTCLRNFRTASLRSSMKSTNYVIFTYLCI